MKELDDNFTIWVPFETLSKADKNGKKEMIVGGVALTDTMGEDKEGEIIEVEGLDCSPFLQSGFVNWHHQAGKDPSAVIGEPISVEKKDGKLFVTSRLYNESKKAVDVYNLGQTLQKSGSNRRLGYSMEGKALERDPLNPGRVKKSKLFHLAITPAPIGNGTGMTVIKGGLKFENQEGSEYLIDIKDENGERVCVDHNFNIIKERDVVKAMVAGEVTGRDTTGQNLTQQPLKVEDVEGTKKKKKDYKKLLKDLRKRRGESENLSKGEILLEISSIFKTDEIDVIKGIYEIVTEINMKPTVEDIQKAKELLSLVKGGDKEKEKSEVEIKKAKEESEAKEKKEKVAKLKEEYKDNVSKGKEYMEKAEAVKVSLKDAGLSEEEIMGGAVERVTPPADLKKGEESTELIKAMDEKFAALNTLFTAKESENEELKKSITDLSTKIEEIGKQSQGPRSLISKGWQDRFPIQKGKDGETVLSLSKDKNVLKAELVKAAKIGEKDQDDIFFKAASMMEYAGTFGSTPDEVNAIAARIKNKLNIQVVA